MLSWRPPCDRTARKPSDQVQRLDVPKEDVESKRTSPQILKMWKLFVFAVHKKMDENDFHHVQPQRAGSQRGWSARRSKWQSAKIQPQITRSHDPEIAEKDEIALILSQGAAVNFKPLKFLQQAKDPAKANLSKNHQTNWAQLLSWLLTHGPCQVSSIFSALPSNPIKITSQRCTCLKPKKVNASRQSAAMKIWKSKRKKFRREPGMILKTEISSVCFLKTTENLYRFDNFLYTYFDAIDLPHGVLSVFQSRFASLQTWISGLRMSIWAAGGAKSPTIMRYEVAFRQSVRNDRLTDAGAVSKCHWKKKHNYSSKQLTQWQRSNRQAKRLRSISSWQHCPWDEHHHAVLQSGMFMLEFTSVCDIWYLSI